MTYPLARYSVAEGLLVRWIRGVLRFSTLVFYAGNKNPVSFRDLDDAYATDALIDAHGDDPRF